MGQVYKPSNSTVCMEIVFFILYSTMIYQNHIKHTQLDIKVIYQVPVKSVQSFTFLTSLLIPNSFIQSETFIKALSFSKKQHVSSKDCIEIYLSDVISKIT